jgi:hypothetical protein
MGESFQRKMVFGILVVALSVLFAVSGWAAETVKIRWPVRAPLNTGHETPVRSRKPRKAVRQPVRDQGYPANQLGDYTQVYEEIMRGTLKWPSSTSQPVRVA